MRIFIPNLDTMVKPITTMLKKNILFTWTNKGNVGFEDIKEAIASTPTLINPNFGRDFIFYTVGGESSISIVLTQLNDKKEEHPIAF